MKRLLIAFSFLLLSALSIIASELEVHFVDVGQGHGVVLRSSDAVVVVDAGRSDVMAEYLSRLDVSTVDLLVASHAHADHIGGMPAIFQRFSVPRVWYNGQTHTTQTFERFIDAVLASDAQYREPSRGEKLILGRLELTVLHPRGSAADYRGNLHDQNIVIRGDFGRFSLLLMGDAEIRAEQQMLAAGIRLAATVFQLGHHGSHSSSSEAFLTAVSPSIAVYQAKLDNSYGHPHDVVLARVANASSASVYGTDRHGSVVITTDGSTYSIRTEREPWGPRKASPSPEATCVDINTASLVDLTRIVHIGEQRAHQLIELRPFRAISQLTRISGIGAGRLQEIRQQGLICSLD